jgi:hypothetical protein
MKSDNRKPNAINVKTKGVPKEWGRVLTAQTNKLKKEGNRIIYFVFV